MKCVFTKIELQLIYNLLDNEFADLIFDSDHDPLFQHSLRADRLLRIKILRDKVSNFLSKEE